jgi:hypothetical protein
MLSSLLTRAGGFTSKAYLLGGVLIRESTRVLQKQQLNAAIDRLEARIGISWKSQCWMQRIPNA